MINARRFKVTPAQDKVSIGEDYTTWKGRGRLPAYLGRRGLPAWSAPFLRSYSQRVRRAYLVAVGAAIGQLDHSAQRRDCVADHVGLEVRRETGKE